MDTLAETGDAICHDLWYQHDIVAEWAILQGELFLTIGRLCLAHVYNLNNRRVYDSVKVTPKSLQQRELGGRLQFAPACSLNIPPTALRRR